MSFSRGASGPLLVFGPRSLTYDFGPRHPLTPLRFGPGIDLLRAVGAEPGLSPTPASDEALFAVHQSAYIETVRSFSVGLSRDGAMGVGLADNPAFAGMHEAAASVAGGSLVAMDAILGGRVEHAFHPGGGLHHAMASRAAGFCIYNDVALAVARARDAGHRVLYVDLDVHHGDGTQAFFWNDPQVLTYSIHESGHSLFPGTGMIEETGGPDAPGLAVNTPLDEGSGDESWWSVLELVLPALASSFRPTFIVSQHGCDSHALDPLAHLRLTTASAHRAARLVDRLAHEHADGRWLATGGGGYDAYRVVPRAWALVWLAQAHREPPEETPASWRERWTAEGEAFGQAPLPSALIDPAGTVAAESDERVERTLQRAQAALERSLELQAAG